jgi:tetratricopeptide (TPR) repeat protein
MQVKVHTHYVEMILVAALIFDVIAAFQSFNTEEITNKIEENLAYSLDENLVGAKHLQKFSVATMAYLEGQVSSLREYQRGNYLKSERILNETKSEFKSKTENISQCYNKSIYNTTSLKNEAMNLSSERAECNKYKRLLETMNFLLLIGAFFALTYHHKQKKITNTEKDTKEQEKLDLLMKIKIENKELKESIKKLDDLLIEYTKEAWKNKGSTLNGQGKYEGAIQAYNMAIKIDPQDADAWNSKGSILKLLGRTTEADASFAKAKELRYIDDPSLTRYV